MAFFLNCRTLISTLLAVGALSFAGCGGGSSSPNTPTQIPSTVLVNEVVVPQAPDLAANATVLGVDSNKNGVRDDVERLVAAQFGKANNSVLLALAKAYQDFLVTPVGNAATLSSGLTAILTQSACLSSELKAASAGSWVKFSSLDTIARMRAFEERTSAVSSSSNGFPSPATSCGK